MSLPISARRTAALLTSLALAACRSGHDAAADSALDRDLTLAASAPAPRADAFADTAISTTPVPAPPPRATAAPSTARASRPTPRPTPPPEPTPRVAEAPRTDSAPNASAVGAAPAPTGAGHTIGTGTSFAVKTQQAVCSKSSRPGDRFVATLNGPITSPDGASIPAGTDVVLELSTAIPGTDNHGRFEFIARGISIDGYIRPLDAEVAFVDATLEQHDMPRAPGQPSDAGKVGKGAMTGAILGRVFGGRGAKGAVIGAAAGAAVGAAGAAASHVREGCLPQGSIVRMRLTGPLNIS